MTSWRALLPILLLATPLHAQDISTLGWLSGCWEQRTASTVTREHWMSPEGGTMLGVSRTVRGARTTSYEFLRLATADGQLRYIAAPSNQRETPFTASVVSDTLAIFENPAHDFPQRIAYRRRGRDSVIAEVGTLSTPGRRFALRYARTACEAPPSR